MSKSKIPLLASSDDIQDPNRAWYSTISFRRFRAKHTELSRMHWTSLLGSHYISGENGKLIAGEKLTFAAQPLPFGAHVMPLNKEEMTDWLPKYEHAIRNAILLLCSGNLELYMKRIARFHLVASGYASPSDAFALTAVGEAIGRPVLQASTIHVQLTYLQDLLGIDFGMHLEVWKRA